MTLAGRTNEQKRQANAVKDKAEEVLDCIARGAETYATWHHLDVADVKVVNVHWYADNTMVVEYVCR
jgi:trehalose utilization protein